MEENELRARVVEEARSWIGTPYHEGGRIKGAGVDCAMLLAEVFEACGIVEHEDVAWYGRHWYVNAEGGQDERYMFRLIRHARKLIVETSWPTLSAQPGNIALVRCLDSKVFNHAGILTKWPYLVHAVGPAVEEIDASQHRLWAHQALEIFDPFRKPE